MGLHAVDFKFECSDDSGRFDLSRLVGNIQEMDAFIGYGSGLPAPPGVIIVGGDRIMRDAYTGEPYSPERDSLVPPSECVAYLEGRLLSGHWIEFELHAVGSMADKIVVTDLVTTIGGPEVLTE